MKRKKKQRLIVDVDSTEDPAHGKQEHVAFNGHFGKNCFHPLFAFTSDGNCLRAKLSPGNVHSADGVVAFLDPIVKRYRSRFILYHGRRWQVHVASAFPLAGYYRAVFG
jgi:Transposase DDE domain group 1